MTDARERPKFTSRYGDGPLPDPETMCRGGCEGLGCYPDMENYGPGKKYTDIDAVPFIKCEQCGGTGKREPS
jgi:hypothetical protein